jgi:DNA-binding response OmpR family regulator
MIPHILVVEADAAAAQVTSAILTRALPHAQVLIAADGAAARGSMAAQPPDVVIVDPVGQRPEQIGLVQQVQLAQPGAQIIVLTSAPTPALRREMADLGVAAYLEKPALLAGQIAQVLAAMRPPPLAATPAAAAMQSHE